jgi:hypothetical protein
MVKRSKEDEEVSKKRVLFLSALPAAAHNACLVLVVVAVGLALLEVA